MKIQEAIENLKYLISGDCTGTQMDFVEEIEMAIESLEKQIPKKPHKNYEKLNIKWCKCGCYLGELKNEQNYCKNCGQALDWSDCPTEKGDEGK